MDFFDYKNNQLFAEDVAIEEIAHIYGTPTYVYSKATLERHWIAFNNALSEQPHLICYAVKANSNIAVLNVLARLGSGFDIVSGGELARVIKAGGDPKKVIFSGVAKREDEIRYALENEIHCFNVESHPELDRINKVASEMGKVAPISLRVNPDVDAKTHPYISTGLKSNKFGIAANHALASYRYANSLSNLAIKGMDCHIGSQLTDLAPFEDAMDRLLTLVDQLENEGIHLSHLDIGGGLGVTYHDETPPDLNEYASRLAAKLGNRKLTLVLEPGRAIAANAGILITKVEFIKQGEDKHFAIVDAAMNDLLRPALYSAWQNIIPVNQHSDAEATIYDIVGPVCETGDFLGKERLLKIKPDDLLAVRSAGAYGFVMASNYNSRCRPAEIMVDGKHHHQVRARELLEDLWRDEHVLPE